MNARWFPDPIDPSRIRLHDGANWTERTQSTVSDTHLPTEAGWYPDPIDANRSRYFDGSSWSDQVAPGGGAPQVGPRGEEQDAPRATPLQAPRSDSQAALDAPVVPSSAQQIESKPRQPARRWALIATPLIAAGALGAAVVFSWTNDWWQPENRSQSSASTEKLPTAGPATPSTAPASSPSPKPPSAPVLDVEEVRASTEMWQATWEQVTAQGLSDSVASEINNALDTFSNEDPQGILEVAGDVSDFASMPGSYSHDIEVLSCLEPLLCLVKRISMNPPGGAAGMGILETLVINYETGKRLEIADFIAPEQLEGLVAAATAAVEASGEAYTGIPVGLQPTFEQFPNFVPKDDGLRLYFSEHEVGPFPVEVFVSWSDVDQSGSPSPSSSADIEQALNYICRTTPESKPDLVQANSDPQAVAAIQAVLVWRFNDDPGLIDGQYGPKTVAAVKRMQAYLGVVADGQVGPITWAEIQQAICPRD